MTLQGLCLYLSAFDQGFFYAGEVSLLFVRQYASGSPAVFRSRLVHVHRAAAMQGLQEAVLSHPHDRNAGRIAKVKITAGARNSPYPLRRERTPPAC